MDLKTLSDEDLELHLNAVLNEKERRANIARIPQQITDLKQKYLDNGGDPSAID